MDGPRLCTTRLFDQSFGMTLSPKNILVPFFNNTGTNYYRPWKLCEEIAEKDFGSSMENTKDKFQITLDVQHFRPEEIKVKVNDMEIFIEGKHEERQDDHGFISRQFTRRYALPKDCLSESVISTLSSDGVLYVIANKKTFKEIKEEAKEVPIKMTGPSRNGEKSDGKVANGNSVDMNNNYMKAEALKTDKCEMKKDIEMEAKVLPKEDHCRLLKPELLGEAVSCTEKLLSESRKETDELLKLISGDKAVVNTTTDKLEEVMGQCKSAISELKKEKIADSSMTMESSGMSSMKATSETSSMMSNMSNMTSEITESRESSSFVSVSSSMKATSDVVSEIIREELKEAAIEI